MRTSAPGKLLLAGEYAVLLPGRSCLVAAVDRRVSVHSMASSEWRLLNGDVSWSPGLPVPDELRFVAAAVEELRRLRALPPHRLVTSGEMSIDGQKLGLGSSAAVTVATCAALWPGASEDALCDLADRLHRAAQGGKGSGADVAASVLGGIVRHSREPRQSRRIAFHPELRLLAVWAGASIQTAPRLSTFLSFVEARPEEAERFSAMSEAAVHALEPALVAGDAVGVAQGMGAAREALAVLERETGLVLETPPMAKAAEVAARFGASAKLSGAGGGDCAVVLAMGDEMASRTLEGLRAAGLTAFALDLAREGRRVDEP